MGSEKFKCFDRFLNFLAFLELPFQIFGFTQNNRLGKSLLLKRLRQIFFQTKSYGFQKCQFTDLLTVFWIFLDNYLAISDIIGLIDPTDGWKFFYSARNLLC